MASALNAYSRRSQPWLGTLVEVAVLASGEAANSAMQHAFLAIARVHHAMSPVLDSSDLGRFRLAPVGAIEIADPWTLAVLSAARPLCDQLGSGFDITRSGLGASSWGLQGNCMVKRHPQAILDLGGIAKGFAVDCAVAALQAAGITSGWVNAGGDLRVFGAAELPVWLRPLGGGAAQPWLNIAEGALATSEIHVANSPLPVRHAHVSVAAPQCLWADALTKVVAHGEPEVAAALLAQHGAQAWRHA